ncbi:hypothetical protein NUU61_007821 [Penicillium alfredii]|uniref:Aminoglycoside phosphotransferase domain-containing protein n=1 Tax=Penicillium alfredii TaxID=1506179 RepID=A0A9W9ERK0_9EURO|nr:uncharacterized protein NUU61_007821 [Penicillium alfredii]KAJ5086514.1 hypothetical protein NUU61_007821 [Penicillium alfredii]
MILGLTDLNQSNIFVDEDWNIKCLIDLEWACFSPSGNDSSSMLAIDLISNDDYEPLHKQFMEVFAEEEVKIGSLIPLSPILQRGWEIGTFWYSFTLSSPMALFKIFYDFIQPKFSRTHDDPASWRITMPYWTFSALGLLNTR